MRNLREFALKHYWSLAGGDLRKEKSCGASCHLGSRFWRRAFEPVQSVAVVKAATALPKEESIGLVELFRRVTM